MKNNGLYNPESYDGIPSLFFLEGYEIKDGCMYVSMLDGFKLQVPYSKELEEETIKVMEEQAEIRNTHYNELLKAGRTKMICNSLAMLFESILAAFWLAEGIRGKAKIEFLLGTVLSLLSFSYARDVHRALDDMREIKKYELYLGFYKSPDYQSIQDDPRVYEGVETGGGVLDINTIDKYSLAEVKTIEGNVRKLIKPKEQN